MFSPTLFLSSRMEEKKLIDYIIDRCSYLNAENLLSQKLQLLDLLLLIQKAVKEFSAKIELLQHRPLQNLLSSQEYEECKERIDSFSGNFKVSPVLETSTADYSKHVIDYLFPDAALDANRENAEKVRLVINTLDAEVFNSITLWENSIKYALKKLTECLEKMIELSEKEWKKEEYEQLANELSKQHSSALSPLTRKANSQFNQWKKESYNDPDEYQALIANQLKELLDTDFIIIDPNHLIKSYKNHLDALYLYIDEDDCNEEQRKKFYFLSKLVEHRDGRFMFTKNTALGKYLFTHREKLVANDIEAFFYFQKICMLAYDDMDKSLYARQKEESSSKTKAVQKKEKSAIDISDLAITLIPQECKEAANKVLTHQFTNPKGIVLNSRKQILKAAMKITITSNVQLALLMKICIEVEAVNPAISCPDFVRALIGIGSIEYSDKKAICKMADGMSKKINGYKSKSKRYPPLDKNHRLWKSADREIGNHIFENMNSEED